MEWILIGSLIMNGVQFYWSGNLEAENTQLEAIAKHCKIEEQDERKREFSAATERELVRQDIERVITRSELNIRAADKGDRGDCRSDMDRKSLSILEEVSRRTGEIDKLRMRSAGGPDGRSKNP